MNTQTHFDFSVGPSGASVHGPLEPEARRFQVCTHCGQSKSLDFFSVEKRLKLKVRAICKMCCNAAEKKRRDAKPLPPNNWWESIYGPPPSKPCANCLVVFPVFRFSPQRDGLLFCDSWCRRCRNASQRTPEFRKKKRERIKAEHRKAWKRQYEKSPQRRAWAAKYLREKRSVDVSFKMATALRNRVRDALNGRSKSEKFFELVGCSPKELSAYLESKFKQGMTWKNYGLKGWHIDHIRPCASFDLSNPQEQKRCFHYTNLQPLWAYENLAKSDKILDPAILGGLNS